MAVHGPLLRILRDSNPSAELQRVANTIHVFAVRSEQGQRRPGPDEHANLDALRRRLEQRVQIRSPPLAGQREVRREVPAGNVDVRARLADLGRDSR